MNHDSLRIFFFFFQNESLLLLSDAKGNVTKIYKLCLMQDWHISFGSCAVTETLFACVVVLTFIVVYESEKLSDQRTFFRYEHRIVFFFSCSLHNQLG